MILFINYVGWRNIIREGLYEGHHAILAGERNQAVFSLSLTITLAILFTLLQVLEYGEASFNISDGIYASTFFLATGFHGFHVFVGTCFLTICLLR